MPNSIAENRVKSLRTPGPRQRNRFLSVIAAWWLSAVSAAVLAQEPAPTENPTPVAGEAPLLETVEVTAASQASRADTVTIVGREEIEQQHVSVAYDAMENKPGLHVVRRLGLTGSGLSRLSIRGLGTVGPAGLQVLVDGRPDATVTFAHPTPSALSLQDAAYVEVIHGPSPVRHGSGKTGVVNIVSRPPPPGASGYLEASYGEFGTTENFFRAANATEDGYLRLSGSYRKTDGHIADSKAEVKSLHVKGGYKLNDAWDIALGAGVNKDKFDVFGSFFVPGPFNDPRTRGLDLTQSTVDLTLTGRGEKSTTSFGVWFDDLEPVSQVLDPGEDRAKVNESGIRFKTTRLVSQQTSLTLGLDALRAKVENSPVLPPFTGSGLAIPRARISASSTEVAPYFFAEHQVSRFVTVNGGMRVTDHSEYGVEPSGELGLIWRPAGGERDHKLQHTAFRLRATRGFQSPTLQQLFGIFRGDIAGPANPNLKPEIIKQFELGVNQAFANWGFDLVVFRQEGEDLISTPGTPPPPPPDIQNSGDFANTGTEIKLHVKPYDTLMLHVGVGVHDLEDQFLRTPHATLDVAATSWHTLRRTNDFSISIVGRYAKDIFDIPESPPGSARTRLDNYVVTDVKFNYQVSESSRVFLSVDNITDEKYQLVAGVPMPPRSVFGGFAVEF